MAEVHPGNGLSGGRATQDIVRDDARLLDDLALVLPTLAAESGTTSNSRNPHAEAEGRLVVNFHDDPDCDHSRLFPLPINANTWVVLLLTVIKYADKISGYSKMRVLSIGESEHTRDWLF